MPNNCLFPPEMDHFNSKHSENCHRSYLLDKASESGPVDLVEVLLGDPKGHSTAKFEVLHFKLGFGVDWIFLYVLLCKSFCFSGTF